MKSQGSTLELPSRLQAWRSGEASGIPSVEVKFVIFGGTPVAKATRWTDTDAEVRKRGEQTGLDTLVVHALNDES